MMSDFYCTSLGQRHLCPFLASPGTASETVGSTSVVGRYTHPVLLLIYPQVYKRGVNRHMRSYADVSLYCLQIPVDSAIVCDGHSTCQHHGVVYGDHEELCPISSGQIFLCGMTKEGPQTDLCTDQF